MSRRRTRLREANDPYAGKTDDQLADLYRDKGGRGVPEGWPRTTIIKKLKELN